ncbi:MAG TPA: CHAD domain-containing protein [Pirellulaceae bacterium]|jgi:hypothetical protein|nr:CHAD domain-containing protein [Pirellulaceae bacterium]
MAFRLEGDETIAEALRRIAVEQFDESIAEIDDPEIDRYEAVHQVRRRFKRVRGIVRLARESSPKVYRRENAAYRDVAGELAPFRDAQSAIEVFDAFRMRHRRELVGEPLAKIRERLVEVKAETDPGNDELAARLGQTRERLVELRERAREWNIREEGFAAIAGGLCRLHASGGAEMKAAFKAARKEPFALATTEALHDWRKSVKYLGFALRILTPTWKEALDLQRGVTDRLEKKLGEDHDLALLCEQVATEKERFGFADEAERFLPLAERRRLELRESARGPGRRFYAERPEDFVRRLSRYWKIRNQEIRRLAAEEPTAAPAEEA